MFSPHFLSFSPHSLFLLLPFLLLLALSAAAQADYRRQAKAQTDFVLAHFYDPAHGKYRDTFPQVPDALPWTTMWSNGVQWRALVAAAQSDPAKYGQALADFAQGLREYWDPEGPVPGFNAYCSGPGGDDKYYDDNAWLVLGFLEAYDLTGDPQYLRWAEETHAFVLSGWDENLGGGLYWSLARRSKNTCTNAPAAVSALRLFALTGDPVHKDWADKIIAWTNAHLQDTDGLYWDAQTLDGTVEQTKWTYNTGLMLQANVLLFRQGGGPAPLREAERLADAALAAWQDPATGALQNNACFTHLLCEGLLWLYEAGHDVKYLDAVRRHAAYGDRVVRDPEGGYRNEWAAQPRRPDAPKTLLENASDARLLWLLVPYSDHAPSPG